MRARETVRWIIGVSLVGLAGCTRPAGPRPSAGDADQYVVWSAAIDAITLDEKATPVAVVPLVRPVGGRSDEDWVQRSPFASSLPTGMIAAFFADSNPTFTPDLPRLSRLTAHALAHHLGVLIPAEGSADRAREPIVALTRVTFDRKHRYALVEVWYACGEMCAHGGVLLLRREAHGRWGQAVFLTHWVA